MTRYIFALFFSAFLMVSTIHNAHAESLSAEQKAEIQKLFEEYLLENGEVILQSVNDYQGKLAEQQREEQNKKAQEFISSLKKQKNLPATGNKKGDITIVEFFDYNCGYCRKALNEIQTVLKGDDNIKVIFIDMPILGPTSLEAAKWSLAANEIGEYFKFHQAVMEHNGPKEEQNLEKIAKDLGLDAKKMKKIKESDKIQKQIDENLLQARTIGISGTPGFIIGDEVSPGFIPAAQIKDIIAQARKKAE